MIYGIGYLISTVGGYLVVGAIVFAMRATMPTAAQTVVRSGARDTFQWYHIWVGFTERSIATTLFVWAPGQLAVFVGGWVALKLAAAWSRRASDEHAAPHVLALVGTAISFATAIAAGMYIHPESLAIINKS